MIILKGRVVEGARDFCWRMTEFAPAFRKPPANTSTQARST